MTFQEYRKYDALGLAKLVQKKEITPLELVEIAIQRAEAVNPKINAIIYKMYDQAKDMAKQADINAPFAGVPFLIKDIGIHIKNEPLTRGCKAWKGYKSSEDSLIVEKYRQGGLTFLGRSNSPEFGLTPYTEPQFYGPACNPWNTNKTAGGSSGGSAAAVAAGITPIATASDGGGSIRIPAANCGLFGIKPSRGRVSLGNTLGEWWSGAVVEGCVSRSVRDSAAFLDLIQGNAPGDLYLVKPPIRSYLEEIQTSPKPLKIGFSTKHTLGHGIDSECIAAVKHAAGLLESLGHQVEEVELPFKPEDLTEIFLMMVTAETAADLQELSQYLNRRVRPSDVETTTYALGLLGRTFSAKDFVVQKRRWNEVARRVGAFHEQYDLLLTSTVSMLPFDIGAIQPSTAEITSLKMINTLGLGVVLKASVGPLAEKTFSYIPYTAIANMTGQPSMSVPLYWTKDNLPVGTMLSAALGREDLLFQLAAQLEQAQPWFDIMPEL
ncbi:MAG: amidase family protein [Saprospiraceae bacterium]|nr:amidase family protein [Saprospiraceae bacterium]